MFHWIRFILIAGVCGSCQSPHHPEQVPPKVPESFRQVDSGVEVFIGGQPGGYDALQQMGFRSVIDVDATPPGVRPPAAMTIVHLPLRYSGITHQQASELIAVLEELERPVYIHCHHGTNRAPAAAAVGLIGTGELSSAQGMQLMDQAGADAAFQGLFRSVADARVIPSHERAPRVSDIQSFDSFAVLMAKIDEQTSLLAMETSGVSPSSDAAAESAALVDLLRVAFDGCAQMEEEGFRNHAVESIAQATALEHALRRQQFDQARNHFAALNATCSDCHRAYRD